MLNVNVMGATKYWGNRQTHTACYRKYQNKSYRVLWSLNCGGAVASPFHSEKPRHRCSSCLCGSVPTELLRTRVSTRPFYSATLHYLRIGGSPILRQRWFTQSKASPALPIIPAKSLDMLAGNVRDMRPDWQWSSITLVCVNELNINFTCDI